MSIQSEIERIEGNIADTYTELSTLGADMPAQQNSDNLPGTAKSVKAVLYTEQTLTEGQQAQARSNIGVTAPDWNASEGEPGHVLNRTHWADTEETVLLEKTVTISNNVYMEMYVSGPPFVLGDTYTVEWDGATYECVCGASTYMGYNALGVGNEAITGSGENTGEPFVVATIEGMGWGVFAIANGEHSLRVLGKSYTYHTIPPEYIGGSKPYYIDLVTIEDDIAMQYVTEATQIEVQNALLAGYQVVVRRMHPQYYLFDFFMMDRRTNHKELQFYRMNGYSDNRPVCEVLVFVPNDASGGYDIIPKEYSLATASEIPKSLKNPYALTINGTTYDGSEPIEMTTPSIDDINALIGAKISEITNAEEVSF